MISPTITTNESIPKVGASPEQDDLFCALLAKCVLPNNSIFRDTYIKMLREHFEKDPQFPEKLETAKTKAHKLALKVYGRPEKGWLRNYWVIEKYVVREECRISWWMSPPELNPDILFEGC